MIYKKQIITVLFIVFSLQSIFSQVILWGGVNFLNYVTNFDTLHSDAKLGSIEAYTLARLAANQSSTNKLENMVDHQTQYLIDRYEKNSYDGESSFIGDNKTTIAMSAGSLMAATTFSNTGYYMTANKKEYMENFNFDKSMLAFLQVLDYDNINTGQRQEIYRLRRELTKQFSYNDREVMSLFGLPAIHYALENDALLLQIINGLQLLE